jgi:hypothetical protein
MRIRAEGREGRGGFRPVAIRHEDYPNPGQTFVALDNLANLQPIHTGQIGVQNHHGGPTPLNGQHGLTAVGDYPGREAPGFQSQSRWVGQGFLARSHQDERALVEFGGGRGRDPRGALMH